MISSSIKFLLYISIGSLLSCGQNNAARTGKLISDSLNKNIPGNAINSDTAFWLSPKNLTPFSFLEIMKKKQTIADEMGVIMMTDSFPGNWLKREDIDSLISLVNSNEKCNCFLDPLSSYIPHDSADVGGYAIAMVSSFRQKKQVSFGLYACPKTNKKEADDLIKWWAKQNR